MKQYRIFAGMGGGFGGAQEVDVMEFANKEAAKDYAYEVACETYNMYAGMHGLRSVADIMEEDECDEENAEYVYDEEREDWLDYYVEEVSSEEPT
jgi:hypothetical protein